jgi:4-aminobutyrate aminotransferase
MSDLASKSIQLVTELPGPRAREMIAQSLPHMSPSLIFCYPLMVKRAQGCMVEDVDGNILMDAQAGVATASTGHCHPKVAAAVKAQVDTLIHICGTDFHYPGYGALAKKLGQLAPGGGEWQVFLSNSGTEAVEAAIKLARHHTGRSQLIAFRGGFHGRSLGSLSLTASKTKYRKGFGPLTPGVHHVNYGDAESIERDLFPHTVPASEVAAIVVEPILGEGGYIVPKKEFLVRLRELCDQHGILLVFDEVQSGMGRTGKMFAAEHFGVRPDIITLAKGLSSGMPLGAMMARKEVMTWTGGTHGSTCGGNPVCIAAALATVELLETALCENSTRVGAFLKDRLTQNLMGKHGVIDVRGLGLMIGVEFDSAKKSSAVANLCYQRGLLVLECGTKAIRLSPPLVITQEQAATAADVFIAACKDVSAKP